MLNSITIDVDRDDPKNAARLQPLFGFGDATRTGRPMTEMTVRRHSVSRRTIFAGTAGLLGAAVVSPGARAQAPADTNVYPLTMKPVTNPGDPVALGVGPDAIIVTVRRSDSSNNSMAILLDNKVIAGPLLVSGTNKSRQIFTLRGKWGPFPHSVQFVSGGIGTGLSGLVVDSVQYNFIPLVYNGGPTDSRRAPYPPNATGGIWDNLGIPMTFSDTHVALPPPPPPQAVLSPITGATINGAIAAPATLAALVGATPASGVLALPAGTFVGTTAVAKAMTIQGAGMGRTIIDCSNLEPTSDKAVFVPTVAGVVFKNMTIKGAAVADSNGAGIREAPPGTAWSAENVEFTGNQDGTLTSNSNITLTGCNFHDNGAGDGQSHEAYFGSGPTSTITLNKSTFTCGRKSTHALKSRAGKTIANGCVFTGNGDQGQVGGSVVDLPDGGLATFAHCTLKTPAGSGNRVAIGYALEAATKNNNAAIGKTLTLGPNVVLDVAGLSAPAILMCGIPDGVLVIGPGCTYTGSRAPVFHGWGSVTGAFAKASAP
jgi:hypothetical protein